MSIRTRRLDLAIPALCGLLLLAGCGGKGPLDPDEGPSPGPGSTETVLNQGWALEPLQIMYVDAGVTGTGGTVDATVEWTFAANDVDLYVTATACSAEQFAQDRCAYKAKADSTTAKPERVSFSVSGGDSYRFWIVNFGPQRESGTFQAVLRR
jgi:hypothetical protein